MGSGFKTFTAGSVLTASDVNNYLMEQSIPVFATTTARDSAITSAEDGMMCYVTDDDAFYCYENIGGTSAWRRNMPAVPHTSTTGLLTPTGTRTTSSTTYGNFPGTDLLKIDNFVKHRADSQLLVTIQGGFFSDGASGGVPAWGVSVNSINYDVGVTPSNLTNQYTPFSVTNLVNVPTAGTYTIQALWKSDSGSVTYSVNGSAKFVMTVTEMRP